MTAENKPIPSAVAPDPFADELEAQRYKEAVSALQQRQVTDDLIGLLKDRRFLRYIARVTKALGVNRPVFHPNSTEAARRDGRRMVAVDLLEEIRAVDREASYEIDRIANPTIAETEASKKK